MCRTVRHILSYFVDLKKQLLSEWRKMSQTYTDKVLASWPKRVFMIYKARGSHTEHRLYNLHFSYRLCF